MTSSNRVIFFGNEQLATGVTTSLPILHALLEANVTIVAIVVNDHEVTSRREKVSPVEVFATEHNIQLLKPAKPIDIIETVADLRADCGVLAAYGRIIPQSLIDAFPHGIINLHPSLLPRHRGPTPLEQTILDGDSETGVSIMALALEMDAGSVYIQEKLALDGTETKQYLADTLGSMGANAIASNLTRILSGDIQPTPQNNSLATYCKLLNKADSPLDPSKPAQQLERKVRAFEGWPKSRLTLLEHPVIVTKAHVGSELDPLTVRCDQNTFLAIDEVIAPSGKKMNAEAFIHGYKR